MSFETLLAELGSVFGSPLGVDEHGACAIELEEGPELRLEPVEDSILIGMQIGTVAPGKGRANFFRAMLIANGRPYPRFGDFSYAKTIDQVILSDRVPMEGLTGEKLAGWILALADQGNQWQEAIKSGRVPEVINLKE